MDFGTMLFESFDYTDKKSSWERRGIHDGQPDRIHKCPGDRGSPSQFLHQLKKREGISHEN
jgi:hypothetical protein